MPLLQQRRPLAMGLATTACAMGLIGAAPLTTVAPARADGTPSMMEFRWDNTKDYRKLYFFMTETSRLKRSEYYLILRPKDRKTALLKLTINAPSYFDATLEAKRIKLCTMSEGGMLKRTRCEKTLPATIVVSPNGKAIEVFPETPIPDNKTIGVYMTLFNPFNAGMYQFNALGQAPGTPVSTYLGSWLIQIDPS